MKRKLVLIILAAYCFSHLVFAQTETYTVMRAEFSSDKYDEFSPVYYGNGLVFCSTRSSKLLNYSNPEEKGLLKINYVDLNNGRNPGKMRLFSRNLTTRFNDGPATFNSRGDTIYYSRNIFVHGSLKDNSNPRNKLGIFSAVFDGNKWIKPTDFRFNNEYYNITTPYLSPDGKRLFFASDNPQGYGGTDIYYSQWKGTYWSDPVNLGPAVNTPGNESYPFVNVAGGLFFSSDGHPGLGGKDIYYTIQKDTTWLPPVRLDEPINSEYDDFSFTCDSTMSEGYFSSKRNNKTADIYHFETNIHQVFYCDNQRINEYCFKFRDEEAIGINAGLIKYEWDFGDGSKAEGLNAEHCYGGPGRYKVKLNLIDRKSGRIFFTKLSYDLDLREIEQPVIATTGNMIAGSRVALNGLSSHFPDSKILTYTWYFGDGYRDVGESVTHVYRQKGDYDVKLGLILQNRKTGVIYEACSVKKLNIFSNEQEKVIWEKSHKEQISKPYITDYDHAFISNLYSAEKELGKEIVWRVEILTSRKKLDPGSDTFRNVPSKYNLRETYLPDEKIYSYTINEEMDLMLTYVAFNEMIAAGYGDTKVRAYILKDQAEKDLYAFLKIFGTSADNFFRKNDFTLTSAGTQLLDLIIGFMSKYPKLRLEIATHTDNQGSASSNMVLSQRRAESMVNYLIINGVPSNRLVAKGYGPTKPVASNMYESDRKLNRRVEFNILR